MIIDFDEIETWSGELDRCFVAITGTDLAETIKSQAQRHKYYESHGQAVLKQFGRSAVLEQLRGELADHQIRLYHGTRLTSSGYQSMKAHGLMPLDLSKRRLELEQLLCDHPDWAAASLRMDTAIRYIENGRAGTRVDDRVHFCLSRDGLLKGCNHYLQIGGEVDNHILSVLFPGDTTTASELLMMKRMPYLASAVFDFNKAIEAFNPYGIPTEGSTLLTALVEAWAYRKVCPGFMPGTLRNTTAAYVRGKSVKLDAIVEITPEDLQDDE